MLQFFQDISEFSHEWSVRIIAVFLVLLAVAIIVPVLIFTILFLTWFGIGPVAHWFRQRREHKLRGTKLHAVASTGDAAVILRELPRSR